MYKSANLIGKDGYRNPALARKDADSICSLYEQQDSFEELVRNGMGKEALKALLNWINHDLKFQLSFSEVVESLTKDDIPAEIRDLLAAIRSKEAK